MTHDSFKEGGVGPRAIAGIACRSITAVADGAGLIHDPFTVDAQSNAVLRGIARYSYSWRLSPALIDLGLTQVAVFGSPDLVRLCKALGSGVTVANL
ncbi:hypothetical protein [Pandoraea sp. NE5]|uniref:hypothetical protein n=1 Tax=Pandoraea sp. NE5 TaxID=2904129 RepID=UPI0021C361C4|nr:hypothetical protein [Pandoraea sp. NE5]